VAHSRAVGHRGCKPTTLSGHTHWARPDRTRNSPAFVPPLLEGEGVGGESVGQIPCAPEKIRKDAPSMIDAFPQQSCGAPRQGDFKTNADAS